MKKIIFVIIIASLSTLSLLLSIQFFIGDDIYRKSTESGGYLTIDEEISFYHNLPKNKNLVFLVGSSHIVPLNATIISNNISTELSTNYDVYNLGKIGDSPVIRLQTMDEIVESEPKLILYGISYRDFQIPINEEDISLPKFVLSNLINDISVQLFPHNPQLLSLFLIKTAFQLNQNSTFDLNLEHTHKNNTPFYNYNSIPSIQEFDEIKNQESSVPVWTKQTEKQRNIVALKNIIEKSEEKNIKFIIFTTPLHQIYLNSLENSQKEQFKKLLSELEEQFDIEIYDLTNSYIDHHIWQDASHVSYHKDVTIFNNELSNIIVDEMKK